VAIIRRDRFAVDPLAPSNELDRSAEAEPLALEAVERAKRHFPGDHFARPALSALGVTRATLGRAVDAEPPFNQAVEMFERLEPGGNERVRALVRAGDHRIGNTAAAEPLFERALTMARQLQPRTTRSSSRP
jgi:hypothetical protein